MIETSRLQWIYHLVSRINVKSIELNSEQQLLSLYNPTMKVKHFEITSPRATAILRSENLIISGPWKMTMDKS